MAKPAMLERIVLDKEVMCWAVCLFCSPNFPAGCLECYGTDRDPIPWAELFKDARVNGAGSGKS